LKIFENVVKNRFCVEIPGFPKLFLFFSVLLKTTGNMGFDINDIPNYIQLPIEHKILKWKIEALFRLLLSCEMYTDMKKNGFYDFYRLFLTNTFVRWAVASHEF